MAAPDMPTLQQNDKISKGRLSNGISYYLINNSSQKGVANFSLVQRALNNIELNLSKTLPANRPEFAKRKFYSFFADNGVGYKKYGYVERLNNESIVYRFENVPVQKKAISDTTLLILFNLAIANPYEQAIIIAGDIDKKYILERLNALSIILPTRDKRNNEIPYEWKPKKLACVKTYLKENSESASIKVLFSTARFSQEKNQTIQALISDFFAQILKTAVEQRLKDRLRRDTIPECGINCEYLSSVSQGGDEQYVFSISTKAEFSNRAVVALAETLAAIDSKGLSLSEYKEIEKLCFTELHKKVETNNPTENALYIDLCISAFLYGTLPILPQDQLSFLKTHKLQADKANKLFNSFSSAILDKQSNLILEVAGPKEVIDSDIYASFHKAWEGVESNQGGNENNKTYAGDSLGLFSSSSNFFKRHKITKVSQDVATNGEVWHFSNGIKVIFKELGKPQKRFSYSLILNGGLSSIPALKKEECAYVNDLFELYDVGGLNCYGFRNMLRNNGIDMSLKVGLTDMEICGSAPNSSISLLMKSLLTISKERSFNKRAYEYYCRCEALKQTIDSTISKTKVKELIDSLTSPHCAYSAIKGRMDFSEKFPLKVERYLAEQFANMNDGVFVITGDFTSEKLKNLLNKFLGEFHTGNRLVLRPKIDYTTRTGSVTHMIDYFGLRDKGSEKNDNCCFINFSILADYSFTGKNYILLNAAVNILNNRIIEKCVEEGLYFELKHSFDVLPKEKFQLDLFCSPLKETDLPYGIKAKDIYQSLIFLRQAVKNSCLQEVSESELALCKKFLEDYFTNQFKNPDFILNAARYRYSYGKDVFSHYKEDINSISLDSLRELLNKIESSAKVELVVNGTDKKK